MKGYLKCRRNLYRHFLLCLSGPENWIVAVQIKEDPIGGCPESVTPKKNSKKNGIRKL